MELTRQPHWKVLKENSVHCLQLAVKQHILKSKLKGRDEKSLKEETQDIYMTIKGKVLNCQTTFSHKLICLAMNCSSVLRVCVAI